jgi:threonine aldolase
MILYALTILVSAFLLFQVQPVIAKIKERYFFYPWIEEECIVRWMCSFDTTEDDVKDFVKVVAEAVKG